jgi:secreted trypsin-like serine protease
MYKSAVMILFGCFLSAGCGSADGAQFEDDIGQADAPVIGGTTDTGDPSIVAIFAHQPTSNSGSLCTGTVISSRAVLTAAHCVDPRVIGSGNTFDVYQGTYFGSSSSRLSVSSTAFDPGFDQNHLENGHDIAVVTLAKATTLTPVPFNTVALGSANLSAPVRVVGCGANSHNNTGAGTKRTVTTTVASIYSLFVKIGTSNQQTCHGDSGGPALQKLNGVESVIGVTSFGSDRSTTNVCFGGGYDTRVDEYADFIESHL